MIADLLAPSLSVSAGIGGIVGILTLAVPDRFRQALRDPAIAELTDRPAANPLRWFYLFWRFIYGRRGRTVIWGVVEIILGLGLLVLPGVFLFGR